MKILIHGRKDGYHRIYPEKETPQEFYNYASDIQSASASNNPIYYGKGVYTLAFAKDGCIFTKFIFGFDVGRGQLGEIGISIFVQNTQKLAGGEIKSLLDELVNVYSRNYIINNRIVEPQNGFDWLLFTSIANRYDTILISRSSKDDSVEIGTSDPAFHYYNSDNELIEHFDKPFQEEYNPFKQILFIDKNLKDIANPLNVLRNSGVELNPDLKNEYYYLNNYSINTGISIFANGKLRSDLRNSNSIRAKWQVEINYSKDDRCYEPIKARGTIADLSSDIHNYLEIKGNQISLKYEAFKYPLLKEKNIYFKIIDREGNVVDGAEISYKSDYEHVLKETGNTIHFKGEEILKQWAVKVRKGNNFVSNEIHFRPLEKDIIEIDMHDIKEIQISASIDGKIISDFTVIPKSVFYQTKSSLVFRDESIYQECTIEVTKSDGSDYFFGIYTFTPKNESQINIQLTKKHNTNQPGNKSESLDSGEDHAFIISFEKIRNEGNSLVLKRTVFARSVVVFVLIFGIWAYFHVLGNEEKPKNIPLRVEIQDYVEGDSLILETLNDYKDQWKHQEPENKSPGITIWHNLKNLFGGSGDKSKPYSTKYEEWKITSQSIERARNIRELINKKKFLQLKSDSTIEWPSSDPLSDFKNTINKLDSTNFDIVRQKIDKVSTLTLKQITYHINIIINSNVSVKKEQSQNEELDNNAKMKNVTPAKANPVNSLVQNNNDNNLFQQQLDFQNKFWLIVYNSTIPSKDDFEKWYKTGSKISTENEYKKFYTKYLMTTKKFEKLNDFFKKSASERLKIKTLDDLKKQITSVPLNFSETVITY